MFAGLLALLCGANGLNVVNSYVGRNFMSAIAERQTAEFVRQAMFYVASLPPPLWSQSSPASLRSASDSCGEAA